MQKRKRHIYSKEEDLAIIKYLNKKRNIEINLKELTRNYPSLENINRKDLIQHYKFINKRPEITDSVIERVVNISKSFGDNLPKCKWAKIAEMVGGGIKPGQVRNILRRKNNKGIGVEMQKQTYKSVSPCVNDTEAIDFDTGFFSDLPSFSDDDTEMKEILKSFILLPSADIKKASDVQSSPQSSSSPVFKSSDDNDLEFKLFSGNDDQMNGG